MPPQQPQSDSLQDPLGCIEGAMWLIEEQVAEGCPIGGKGRFQPGSVVERDLAGDGKAGLIISHDGLQCASGNRSALCGLRPCLVLLYVREGTLLKKQTEALSMGESAGTGSPLPINLISDDFKERTLLWNGQDFEWAK